MGKEIESDEFKKLITLGEEKGFLTYDDVNDLLPSDVISSDQIDDIIMLFGEKNIDIIDTDKGEKLLVKKSSDERSEGKSEDILALLPALGKTGDPVKMYLREMGMVSLLSREGEVEIAKRIEEGERRVLQTVLNSPIAVEELLQLGDRRVAGEHAGGRAGGAVGAGLRLVADDVVAVDEHRAQVLDGLCGWLRASNEWDVMWIVRPQHGAGKAGLCDGRNRAAPGY